MTFSTNDVVNFSLVIVIKDVIAMIVGTREVIAKRITTSLIPSCCSHSVHEN